MKTDITIQSFYAGLILFGLCFIGMMINLGSLVVILSHILPGLILGFLIAQSITHKVSNKKQMLFVIFSTGIHIACVFFVDVVREDEIWTSIKLIIASSVGALLLALVYDLIIVKTVSFVQTFLVPFTIGILASVLSAFCMYYMQRVGFEQRLLEGFLWAGIFSIFPLWYYLFARIIKTRYKAAPKTNLVKLELSDKM